MDFLKLCKETAKDSGTIAGLPSFTTIAGATGRVEQLVGWVRDAWIDIQNERSDWKWMRRRFDKPLVAHIGEYSAAVLDVARVARWLPDRDNHRTFTLYDPDEGKKDEQTLTQISYDRWIERYGRGVHDEQRPSEWAISPINEILLGPTPDKIYRLTGEYRLKPQELLVDADTPEMPEDFHRVIIAEAIRLMGRSDEAYNSMNAYGAEYDRLRNALVRDQTPDMVMGFDSLA